MIIWYKKKGAISINLPLPMQAHPPSRLSSGSYIPQQQHFFGDQWATVGERAGKFHSSNGKINLESLDTTQRDIYGSSKLMHYYHIISNSYYVGNVYSDMKIG